MATKYYRHTLQGEHSVEEALRALGDAASNGLIVRVDTAQGQTHVTVAAAEPSKAAAGAKITEVSERDVTKTA